MVFKTDAVRGGETTKRHIVLKMLVVSTVLAACALAIVAGIS
ncbi:hypothetical protein JM93_01405 [Roseibium hamelinense]|uniref:Uncharacterized protein n=1 Tax=Roseibium hamelinense TaxID=150831 RepID=A0A562TAY9_9HYPH|nr:hypothetical protein [Roseibium hamelinense]TWI90424.1 hypothetical protein JM93_01405 [Roseibium hamelinense]